MYSVCSQQARARSRHCRMLPTTCGSAGHSAGAAAVQQIRHARHMVRTSATSLSMRRRVSLISALEWSVSHTNVCLPLNSRELPAEVGSDPVERPGVDAVPARPVACAVRRGRAPRTASGRPRPSRRCRRAAKGPSPAPPSGRRSRAWPARSETGSRECAGAPKPASRTNPTAQNGTISIRRFMPAPLQRSPPQRSGMRPSESPIVNLRGHGQAAVEPAVSPARPGVARERPAARTGARPARS